MLSAKIRFKILGRKFSKKQSFGEAPENKDNILVSAPESHSNKLGRLTKL
jgi:hypothetical protein